METTRPAGRSGTANAPGFVAIGIILTAGLFMFAWMGLVARRLLPRQAQTLLWLLPLGAMLWVGGATFMLRGALAPTVPGETGNPQFLAGFILAVLCLALVFVFNQLFAREIAKAHDSTPIARRVVGFTICAVGFLVSQLVVELTPVRPQNHDILAIFQLICIMVGAVLGIQWVERVHEAYSKGSVAPLTDASSAAVSERSAQRL
jgi:hypothetical protein